VSIRGARRLGRGAGSRRARSESTAAGVRIQLRTLAFGVYDHNLVCAGESLSPEGAADLPGCVLRERLWKIRARP